MKTACALAITLAACSTTTGMFDSEPTLGAGRTMSLGSPSDDATPGFPTLLSRAELPTADRIGPAIGGEKLATTVRLCVSPDGSVDGVDIERSSGTPSFDAAVKRDLVRWKYDSFRAPDHIRVCKPITLVYAAR